MSSPLHARKECVVIAVQGAAHPENTCTTKILQTSVLTTSTEYTYSGPCACVTHPLRQILPQLSCNPLTAA